MMFKAQFTEFTLQTLDNFLPTFYDKAILLCLLEISHDTTTFFTYSEQFSTNSAAKKPLKMVVIIMHSFGHLTKEIFHQLCQLNKEYITLLETILVSLQSHFGLLVLDPEVITHAIEGVTHNCITKESYLDHLIKKIKKQNNHLFYTDPHNAAEKLLTPHLTRGWDFIPL